MSSEREEAVRRAVSCVAAITNGAQVSQVYGGEWCLDPTAEFREHLRLILSDYARLQSERAEDGMERFGSETAPQIVRRWAQWINDASEDMEEPEWGGKTENDVLNERDFLIRALARRSSPDTRGGDLGSLRPEKASVPSVSGDQRATYGEGGA